MVESLGVANYLGFVKEFVMYVHYGRRWFSGDWRLSLDVIFLKPLAEAFAKYVTGEYSIDQVYEHIRSEWEKYLRDPLMPEPVKDAIKWNLNALTLIKKQKVILGEGGETVLLRITLFDNYSEYEVFRRNVKIGERIETEVDIPVEVREGSGKIRFYIGEKLVKEINVVFVKPKKEIDVVVYEPKEGQEVKIGGKLKIVLEIREKEVEEEEMEEKFIEVVFEYVIRDVKVNNTRRIGMVIDGEVPCDLTDPINCCRYVVGIVKPGASGKFGERIFLKPGIHTVDICVDLQEGEELELMLNIYTPLGRLTKTKRLTHVDKKLTTTIKITSKEAKIIE